MAENLIHLKGWHWHQKKKNRRWTGPREKSYKLLTARVTYRLTWRPWKGICVMSAVSATTGKPVGSQGDNYWRFPDMKRRGIGAGSDGGVHLAALESNYFAQLLPLVEHCALRQYDDKSSREPGWLIIRTVGAAWSLVVKDPDTCTCFTSLGTTLDKALESAALLLGCEDAPWEPDTYLLAKQRTKKK